jgi:hypothetical protein
VLLFCVSCCVIDGKREKRNAYRILVRMEEGKKPLVRPKSTWEDSSKIDLRET